MADSPIQELDSAELPLGGNELFVLEQNGAAVSISAENLADEYVRISFSAQSLTAHFFRIVLFSFPAASAAVFLGSAANV